MSSVCWLFFLQLPLSLKVLWLTVNFPASPSLSSFLWWFQVSVILFWDFSYLKRLPLWTTDLALSHDQHLLLPSFSSEITHVSPRESYSPTARLTLRYCLILQFKWSSVSTSETFALCILTCLLLSGSKTSRLVVVISLGLQFNLIINVLKPTEGLRVRRQSWRQTNGQSPATVLCWRNHPAHQPSCAASASRAGRN